MIETKGISDFYRGDTVVFDITVTDEQTGDPIDLTGATIFFTMKEDPTQSDAEASIREKVITHTDPTGGKTKITIPSAYTKFLTPNVSYYYDFQLVDSANNVRTLLAGRVTVLQDITLDVS